MTNALTISDVIYFITIASAFIGILWHFQRQISEIKIYIEKKFTELEFTSNKIATENKLEMAKNYASIEDLKAVEERLSKSINNLVISIDKLIDKLEKLGNEFQKEIKSKN